MNRINKDVPLTLEGSFIELAKIKDDFLDILKLYVPISKQIYFLNDIEKLLLKARKNTMQR
jgi:hypothetical protein